MIFRKTKNAGNDGVFPCCGIAKRLTEKNTVDSHVYGY